MTARPIIMGPFSVRAFLAGRKTQTRRIISKLRQFGKITEFGPSSTPGYDWHFRDKEKRWNDTRHAYFLKWLPYAVGDRLWVREALNVATPGSFDWQYRADASPIRMMQDDPRASEMVAWAHHKDGNFCSSIHMPKWAARIFLTVTEVRIQRLRILAKLMLSLRAWSLFLSHLTAAVRRMSEATASSGTRSTGRDHGLPILGSWRSASLPRAEAAPKETPVIENKERVIVALDMDADKAKHLVLRLGAGATYKVGFECLLHLGPNFVRDLVMAGHKVMLDLKLHDIPNTVERAVARAADLGASFVTVHAYHQALEAAVKGARGTAIKVLGVTVLTSYRDYDTHLEYSLSTDAMITLRTHLAAEIGCHGVVASGRDLGHMQDEDRRRLLIVTPGIRYGNPDDQKRFVTPTEAIVAGAHYIVVGRPITQAWNPSAAYESIVQEVEAATKPQGEAR